MKFSEKIIQARKAKALTQEDLAEAVGVSRQAVSKWETGEAKPDLEKLMGICKVLDLSMDYLCLDKEPVVTVEPAAEPAKNNGMRYLIVGVCIGLVAAILVGLLAMALAGGNGEPTQQPPESSTVTTAPTTTAAPDYSHMLSGIKVADAKYERVSSRTYRISFVPSIQVPGMQVQIAVRNNLIGTTYYKDATKSGASYAIDFPMPDNGYDYDFIAVCSIGEVTVQFALVNAVSDDGVVLRWKYLWKEQ